MLIGVNFVRSDSCSRPSKPPPGTREKADPTAGRAPTEDTAARRNLNSATTLGGDQGP
jgi:hypothetical protein